MADKTSYTELDVWKASRELAGWVYVLTREFPKEVLYGLVNQIRRSAVSIPSNIAEGCGRNTSKDSLQFFFIARGSLYELETQLYLSFDFAYINKEKLDTSLERINKMQKTFERLHQLLPEDSLKEPKTFMLFRTTNN